ncbi:MAG: hypothetical protein IPO40_12120 [Fibrobacteres bacterium]|nr:hypothetical protein [Fibrobacterota bacterium]
MHDLLPIIRRLRSEVPRPEATSKVAHRLGVLSLVFAASILLMAWFEPFGPSSIPMAILEKRLALALIVAGGIASLQAARRVCWDPISGVKWFKLAIWLWIGCMVAFVMALWGVRDFDASSPHDWKTRIHLVALFGPLIVLARVAFGYLHRLREASLSVAGADESVSSQAIATQGAGPYREGVFPWGAHATILLLIGLGIFASGWVSRTWGVQTTVGFGFLGLIVVCAILLAWNKARSSFERTRKVVEWHHLGVEIWFAFLPEFLCRLLIYKDGVELRFLLCRYFLPYDKLLGPLGVEGDISDTLTFRTHLPDVPETIRIQLANMEYILREIERARGDQVGA